MSKRKQLHVTPFQPVPYFINEPLQGEAYVQTLLSLEKMVKQYRQVLLVGPAGSGKTYLAMHLAHRFDGEVYWFDGSQVDLFTLQLILQHEEILPGRVSFPHTVQEKQKTLQFFSKKKLFIIDNCSRFSPWRETLATWGHCLILSRLELPFISTKRLEMPPAEDEEAPTSWPLQHSVLQKMRQNHLLRPEVEQFLEQGKNHFFSLPDLANFILRALKIVTPDPLREAIKTFLAHLLWFAPEQPIFPAFLPHLFPHQAQSEQNQLLALLEEVGVLRPGIWPSKQPAWVIPPLLNEILREALPEEELRQALVRVVAAGREQLQLYFTGAEAPLVHYWAYHLHYLAHTTQETLVFEAKARLWGDLGYYYYQGEELELATTYLHQALSWPGSWPDDTAVLYLYLGLVNEKKHLLATAVEAYEKAFSFIVYQTLVSWPNVEELATADLTATQLTTLNEILQCLGRVSYQQRNFDLTRSYFSRAAEVQQALYQTPYEFRPLFERECYLALPHISDSDKIIHLKKLIELKQKLTAGWPILRMELVKDYQRLIQLELKIQSPYTGWNNVLHAYTQATKQSVVVYGVDSDETKEIVYQWYELALTWPMPELRKTYKLLRKMLGKEALVVQALRVKIADKWLGEF